MQRQHDFQWRGETSSERVGLELESTRSCRHSQFLPIFDMARPFACAPGGRNDCQLFKRTYLRIETTLQLRKCRCKALALSVTCANPSLRAHTANLPAQSSKIASQQQQICWPKVANLRATTNCQAIIWRAQNGKFAKPTRRTSKPKAKPQRRICYAEMVYSRTRHDQTTNLCAQTGHWRS